jgi:hypothetical protein
MVKPFLPGVMLLICTAAVAQGAKVYYVNQPEGVPGTGQAGVIVAVNPDGTGLATHYTAAGPTDLRGIAVDPENNRLFFAYCELAGGVNPVQVSLRTLPLVIPGGGAMPVTILTLPDGTPGSAMNAVADVEYDRTWQQVYFSQPAMKLLRRCDPAGGNLTNVLTHPGAGVGPRDLGPYFFGLDLVNRAAYWAVVTTSGDTNTAYSKGSLAGVVDAAFSLTTPSRTRDIVADPAAPDGLRLYWNDRQNGAVYSRLAGGGAVLTVASGLNAPHGLVIDPLARKGYVSDTGKRGSGSQASSHRVVRISLDGLSPLEYLSPVDLVAEPWDVALDLTSSSYADWRRRFFAQGAAGTGINDDPDGDGLINLGEYAFFCSPIHADAWKAGQVFDVQPGRIRMARHRRMDVDVRAEVSTNLTDWHWNGDATGVTYLNFSAPESRDEDSEWITVTSAVPGPQRFQLRLSVRLL